jgi:hypothetical protein
MLSTLLSVSTIHAGVPFDLVIAAFNGGVTLAANCSDPFVTTLASGISTIIKVLMGLGVAVAVIGIVVGGLMRATAWGSEQRIAMSNKAITCAVIGLIIVLLGVTLGNQIPTWFSKPGCPLIDASLITKPVVK